MTSSDNLDDLRLVAWLAQTHAADEHLRECDDLIVSDPVVIEDGSGDDGDVVLVTAGLTCEHGHAESFDWSTWESLDGLRDQVDAGDPVLDDEVPVDPTRPYIAHNVGLDPGSVELKVGDPEVGLACPVCHGPYLTVLPILHASNIGTVTWGLVTRCVRCDPVLPVDDGLVLGEVGELPA